MERILQLLIPVLALAIPVTGIAFYGFQRVLRLRIEEARARGAGAAELEALRADVAELRAELGEVHERLDFTERVLIQNRDRQRLPDDPEGA